MFWRRYLSILRTIWAKKQMQKRNCGETQSCRGQREPDLTEACGERQREQRGDIVFQARVTKGLAATENT